jgi:DNA-binding MarR family transcriptional regulator
MHDWKVRDPFLNTWVLLSQTFSATCRATEVELSRHSITAAQFYILMLLDNCTVPLTPGEISSYVFRERHSVSAQLSRMQRAGYVKKSRSQDDERVVRVSITAKGRRLLNGAKGGALWFARDMMAACLSEEETERWDESLKKLRDHALAWLGEDPEPIPPVFDTSGLLGEATPDPKRNGASCRP